MPKKLKSQNQNGFTMIEIIAALAILAFGVVGVYGIFYIFADVTLKTSPRLQAIYLAQEGFEIAKNIRDINFLDSVGDSSITWLAGLVDCATGCQADYKTGTDSEGPNNVLKIYNDSEFLKINSDGFYGYDNGQDTIFKRKITAVPLATNADITKVTVEVTWNYNNEDYSFKIEDYMYNWFIP